MSSNGQNSQLTTPIPNVGRLNASGPILLLAILFVLGAFLSWYFSWFGRELSPEKVSEYLADESHPRHVQHALLQVQQRIEKGDPSSAQWYPRVLALASSKETEFRLTTAWLMGFDNRSGEFHDALKKLLVDPEPIVRRNAALALVRFDDSDGREELLRVLEPYPLTPNVAGTLGSVLSEGSRIARGTLLARIVTADQNRIEIRSPLPGEIEEVVSRNGAEIGAGDTLLTIRSDDASVWEALRGLALIGKPEDLSLIERYSKGDEAVSQRIREQASQTIRTIEGRQHP